MSNAAYTNRSRVRVKVKAQPVEDREEVEPYDIAEDAEVAEPQPNALSPGRKMALGGAVLTLFAVFGLITWLLGSRTGDTAPATVGPYVGAVAPDFEFMNVRTKQNVKLSSLRGKAVFINFWGTWCPPCRQEMPEMQRFYDKYKDKIEILGVSMNGRGDDPTVVKVFVDAAKYSWTFGHDLTSSASVDYQVIGIPSSYFLDKAGIIRAVQVGPMDLAMMEEHLKRVTAAR